MKLKELQNYLQDHKIDFALFYNLNIEPDPNFFYFTQYSGLGCVIIPKKSSPFLLVPPMEFERAKQSAIKRVYQLEKKKFFESVASYIKTKGKIGIDKNCLTLSTYKKFRKAFKGGIADISSLCTQLRVTKTKKEGEYLKKACSYGDKIFSKVLQHFKEFKTESDVAGFIQYQAFKLGLDVSFKPIVASGSHGSMPHYEPKKVKLLSGLCVIDMGVKYKGYCSDMTRTIGIKKVSLEQRKEYLNLLAIQNDTNNKISDGIKCGKLYDYVVERLGKKAKYFTHGLGHGIGVEIHELPNLKPGSKDKIERNVYFTNEPGVYFPGKFGIRIEDSLVLQNKLQRLTKTTKDLIVV